MTVISRLRTINIENLNLTWYYKEMKNCGTKEKLSSRHIGKYKVLLLGKTYEYHIWRILFSEKIFSLIFDVTISFKILYIFYIYWIFRVTYNVLSRVIFVWFYRSKLNLFNNIYLILFIFFLLWRHHYKTIWNQSKFNF